MISECIKVLRKLKPFLLQFVWSWTFISGRLTGLLCSLLLMPVSTLSQQRWLNNVVPILLWLNNIVDKVVHAGLLNLVKLGHWNIMFCVDLVAELRAIVIHELLFCFFFQGMIMSVATAIELLISSSTWLPSKKFSLNFTLVLWILWPCLCYTNCYSGVFRCC